MKLGTITYAEARKRHPKEVEEIVSKLRKGKSKNKDAAASKLTWEYQTAVRIDGSGSLADMLAGKFEAEAARREAMTLDDRVADEVRRTSTCLYASIGHWSYGTGVPNPPEVEARARKSHEETMRERARFDALSPAEQAREQEEALAQLRGMPGFVELRIPRPR